MRSTSLRAALAALVAAGLAAAPGTAEATGETLKRATGNILFAPVDLILAPVVAGKTVAENLSNVDDSLGVRIAYPLPGFLWTTGVQAGAAMIREIAGLLEFLPGLGLAFTESDMDPLFTPVERSEALVDYETPLLYIKFGVNYTTGNY